MSTGERHPAIRQQLAEALAAETRRLDVVWARVSSYLYMAGVLLGGVVAATGNAAFGIAVVVLCLAFVGYFRVAARLASRRSPPDGLQAANAFVMATAPWMFMAGLAVAEGAAYSLSSWIPPLLFLAVMIGNVVRMRPRPALYVGLASAAMFLIVYFAMLLPMLERTGPIALVDQPRMQLLRAGLLAVAGVATSVATSHLRTTVGRAHSAVRERDLFGKYRLVRTIASGGMGEIIEAMYCPEGGFERRVAVKRIHDHLADREEFMEAFRAEAEISARVAHPNVVQVMDFGKVGPSYFLAMEFVDGVTLGAVARRAATVGPRLSTDVVGFIGGEILAGLAHAHGAVFGENGRPLRIVHRDICPQNILLSRNGEVKIADFGIARVLGEALATQTRSLAGHLAYFAPEQASGMPIDERSDLFAVGIMLWELLSGERLFAGTDVAALMAVMSKDIPPVSSVRPTLDQAWDAFFARALDRDPTRRFASARQMARELAALPGAYEPGSAERLGALVEAACGRDTAFPGEAMASYLKREPTFYDEPTQVGRPD